MCPDLKGQFFGAIMQIKKTGASFSTECEMQMNELTILQTISGECGCSDCAGMNLNVREIQERLQISKPAVSYILNTLEKKSYIIREIDPRDRRKISITATVTGRAAVEHSTRMFDRMWERLLTEFGEEDMRHLVALLSRLNNICEQMQADPTDL